MNDTVLISVRLPKAVADALDAAAKAEKASRSDFIRGALEMHLGLRAAGTEQERRRQFSAEYLFLVADLFIQRKFPDAHQTLLSEADARVEVLYAAS